MELKLIDLSYHNGAIDFVKVKTQVDGIILRCGYGSNITSQDDKKFKEYADNCVKCNIPFGIYLYSYAKTMEEAKSEAEHCLRLAEPYKNNLFYPIYLDLEESGTESGAVDRALVFGGIVEKNGYWCGIYANEYWWNKPLAGGNLDRFTKWVAKYGKNDGIPHEKPNISGTYDIWQYSSTGKVDGISGNVDVNICYRDLPAEIKPNAPQEPILQPAQRTYAHKIGEHVVFSTCYRASTDPISAHLSAVQMSKNHGVITRIVDAANPYLLDDGLCWVNDGDIRGLYTVPASALKPEPQVSYYPRYTGDSVSIVEGLKAVGIESSFANRQKIAAKNRITGYRGSADQNNRLLSLLKSGKLIK